MRAFVLALVLLLVLPFTAALQAQGDSLVRSLTGNGSGSEIGRALAMVGDLDRDGLGDYAVGSRDAISLVSGRTGAVLRRVSGPSGSGFGRAIAAAGDLSGDGVPDLWVGAPFASSGHARLISGADGSVLRSVTRSASFAWCVAALADFTGDGHAELAAGGYSVNGVGIVEVFDGASGAQLHRYDLGSNFPVFAMAAAGDVNGDGREDLAIGRGTPFPNDDRGGVRVLAMGGSASVPALIWASSEGSTQLGRSLAGAGDLDGDGRADLLVGEPAFAGGDGRALVYDAAGGVLRAVTGSSGEGLGSAVALVGDYDGDGGVEVAFGASEAALGGDRNRGRVLVLAAADLAQLAVLEGGQASDFFGATLAGGADVTGDGLPNLLVGATQRLAAGPGQRPGSGYAALHAAARFRGTSDGFRQRGGAPGATTFEDRNAYAPGLGLELVFEDPTGVHVGQPLVIGVTAFAPGSPPMPLPGTTDIWTHPLSGPANLLLTGVPGAPFGSPTLPANGFTLNVPAGPVPFDSSFLVQALVPSASAAAGYAATNAHEYRTGDGVLRVDAGNGSDGGTGSAAAPLRTVARALDLAASGGTNEIWVANALDVEEEVRLDRAVRLLGGYDATTWQPTGTRTVVRHDGMAALRAENLTGSTLVRGFHFFARSDPAQHTVEFTAAALIRNCGPQLRFEDCRFETEQGPSGREVGAQGLPGADGIDGRRGEDGQTQVFGTPPPANGGAGAPGLSSGGRGGNGGRASTQPTAGESKVGGGASALGGLPGLHRFGCIASGNGGGGEGLRGQHGASAAPAAHGVPADFGGFGTTAANGWWRAGRGGQGGLGLPGNGGGGGGGGGSGLVGCILAPQENTGGGGGGGGFGGRPGNGGLGGSNGGGAFGVFLIDASPVFAGCHFTPGDGGTGRRGGQGGLGGRGGARGLGGRGVGGAANLFERGGNGGFGGRGGDGAHGGGGAGGHGGPSHCVVILGTGQPSYPAFGGVSTRFDLGAGGRPGPGGSNGASVAPGGLPGLSQAILRL